MEDNEGLNTSVTILQLIAFIAAIIAVIFLIVFSINSNQLWLILCICFAVVCILFCSCACCRADKVDKARNEIGKKNPEYNNLRY